MSSFFKSVPVWRHYMQGFPNDGLFKFQSKHCYVTFLCNITEFRYSLGHYCSLILLKPGKLTFSPFFFIIFFYFTATRKFQFWSLWRLSWLRLIMKPLQNEALGWCALVHLCYLAGGLPHLDPAAILQPLSSFTQLPSLWFTHN